MAVMHPLASRIPEGLLPPEAAKLEVELVAVSSWSAHPRTHLRARNSPKRRSMKMFQSTTLCPKAPSDPDLGRRSGTRPHSTARRSFRAKASDRAVSLRV